ncbi:T-cell differentiation antigen CD6 [Octodon degus]|uniref:T-cell differentiation antigen CD6 n=1 Tax=Octodon degus TaxID=10160 RepID=A0A6P6DSY1_OCTDE|nr:T-cell differentiation antigen CD6 [Octodon degus]
MASQPWRALEMTTTLWLFLGLVTRLTATLSGLQSPAVPTPGQHNASIKAPEPGLGVRLANGSSHCLGEVEVRLGALWAPVCGARWDHQAAEAVCRELGCGGAEATPEPEPGIAVGNTSAANATHEHKHALSIRCAGPKWGLCEVVKVACGGDVGPARVTCAEARDLRLVGGASPCAGRVEMLERGAWGTMCDDAWDLQDAHVACRQLGCGWAVEATPGLRFPAGRGLIHRDVVTCTGDEAHLWECVGRPGDGYCGHKEDAGVVCSEHQSWRLTGGGDLCEGQVEVHFRGVWSTVCDSEWYQPEADVLCRALGCGHALDRPPGQPHSLQGRMFYSCRGEEATPFLCTWRFNNSNLCSQSRAARVLCSGSRRWYNLSSAQVPSSTQPATVESWVTVKMEDKASPALVLLMPSLVLGFLLLCALVFIVILLLRVKGKYALPATGNHQHLLPAAGPAGSNSYHVVPVAISKEAPQPLAPGRVPTPEDSDSDSGSDYEHYDFSVQPPVALTTFYNSQRHRVTEAEAQQCRFQMPPLEEGLEELHTPPTLATLQGPCALDTAAPGDPGHHQGGSSGSSTSSGEDYCNSPRSKPLPWSPHAFSLQQSPGLELAGSQMTFSGSGPPADDSSSTSSGEWYQNFQSPTQPQPTEQFECPGPCGPQPEFSSSEGDYDDIGAA